MKRLQRLLNLKRLLVFALLVQMVVAPELRAHYVPTVFTKAAGGTSPAFQSTCTASATGQNVACTWVSRPSSGYAVVGVIYLGSSSNSISSVCDGTGTDGCTGSSSYTLETQINNSSSWGTVVFFTCNYAGTNTTQLTVNGATSFAMRISSVTASGNSTSGTSCNDGYAGQANASSASWTSPTVATTNAKDLMVGMATNNCSNSASAGTDGSGHSYTLQAQDTNDQTAIQTLAETATGTYSSTLTSGAACLNTAAVFAMK